MAQAIKTFPTFEKQVVQNDRPDGYWIEAFHGSNRRSDIIAYGLASGTISLFHNPSDQSNDQWEKTDIQQLVGPVGMDQADITGNGLNDVIICHHYGATMVNCDPEGGHITWLENPGPNAQGPWKSHYIGRVVSMHRLRVGHFTRRDRVQVMALPIVGRPFDLTSPVHVVLFTQPDNVFKATEWPSEIVSKDHFHIIHDARVKKYNHVVSKNPDADLDSLLIASREGITWVQWNSVAKQWSFTLIGEGELTERDQTGFFGSGGVDVGKIGDDEFAYIPAIEPFHGNTLAVYIKQRSTDGTLQVPSWKRVVVDVYGNVDTHGEGPAHFVIAGDFDGDGDDEFLVALRGPKPYQGVFCYKITDLEKCAVSKWHLSEESAARIAVADFSGDGTLDFATISYNVPGYYEDAKPTVNVYYNTLKDSLIPSQQISIKTVSNQLRVTVPNLEKILRYSNLPFVDIGGTRIAIEAIPPHSSRLVSNLVGIKVLAGSIHWTEDNQPKSKSFLVTPKQTSPITFKSDSNRVTTNEQGAIIVTITLKGDRDPFFNDMAHVTLTNIVPDWTDQESAKHNFKWRKYLGDSSTVEFYNVEGVSIYYEDGTHLCNTQFWTAGKGVDCGLHNHSTDLFCEVHACIVNGTGSGGMTYGINLERDAEQISLPVPTMHEHGPIWQFNAGDGTPSRRPDGSIIYPYHRWLAGSDQSPLIQSYDVWMAVEFNPVLAVVSQ